MEAPQEGATCPQTVLLLLWATKLVMNYGILRGAMKIAPLRQSQAQRWGISKSKEANQGSEYGNKRWRGKWDQVTELGLGWEASDRSRKGCVLQLHHDSAHRMQLILQEEGSEVSGKTFLIGF